jgi:hypothetical protein
MKPSPRNGPERSKKRARPFMIPPFALLAFGIMIASRVAKTAGIPMNRTAVCSSFPSTIRRYVKIPAFSARIKKTDRADKLRF